MPTITTVSGRTKDLPEHISADRVVGLDREGRIVVDDLNAMNSTVPIDAPFSEQPYIFGLTLCCDAYDTGTEDGVVCRSCYDETDIGNYLHRIDGKFPGLDPIASVG